MKIKDILKRIPFGLKSHEKRDDIISTPGAGCRWATVTDFIKES